MQYNQKTRHNYLPFFTYMLAVIAIIIIGIITYTIYKRNLAVTKGNSCNAPMNKELFLSDNIRQVLPVDNNSVMIITSDQNGDATVVVYDHCNDLVLRQFYLKKKILQTEGVEE